MDKLDLIFKYQRKLANKYGMPNNKNASEKKKWIKSMILAIITEACEVIDEKAGGVCIKDWRKINIYDKKYVLNELVDLFHFYVELCLLLGVNAQNLYNAYLKKNKINHKRIKNGY